MTNEQMKVVRDQWHDARNTTESESQDAWDAYLEAARPYLIERGWRLSNDQTYWEHPNYSVYKIEDAYLEAARPYLIERGWRLSDDQTYWEHPNYSVYKIEDAVTIQLSMDDIDDASIAKALDRWLDSQAIFESVASAYLLNHDWTFSIERQAWIHPRMAAKALCDAVRLQLYKNCIEREVHSQ